jgi:peptide/nickel transport system permease protein
MIPTNLQQLIFPVLTLGYNIAFQTRVTRSAMLDVLREDYVRTVYAKGPAAHWSSPDTRSERPLAGDHRLGLAVQPPARGAVLIEVIFVVQASAISSSVIAVLSTWCKVVLLTTILGMVVNLLVDLLYAWLDPRIHYG